MNIVKFRKHIDTETASLAEDTKEHIEADKKFLMIREIEGHYDIVHSSCLTVSDLAFCLCLMQSAMSRLLDNR